MPGPNQAKWGNGSHYWWIRNIFLLLQLLKECFYPDVAPPALKLAAIIGPIFAILMALGFSSGHAIHIPRRGTILKLENSDERKLFFRFSSLANCIFHIHP
ncbi:hypothetical protein PTTG_12604, partial [Puccinia triticina 1-1 BBBD Race 1]